MCGHTQLRTLGYGRTNSKIRSVIWKKISVIIVTTQHTAATDVQTTPVIIAQSVPVTDVKQKMLTLTNNRLNSNGFWSCPMDKIVFVPLVEDLALFDQNGYDLTVLEQHFALSNATKTHKHRSHRTALKQPWFTQEHKVEGAVLNHSLLFERKAYSGAALEQLQYWAKDLPLIHKIIAMRPKWGLDFSMDYTDREGNAFELLHWEYDGFDYDEISAVKAMIEPKILAINWEQAAKDLIKYKDKWHHLDFFAQSEWKCNYFEIPKERFKMVIWN
jgi:hypothetical protein